MALAALDAGIEIVLLVLAEKPGEIGTGGRELVGTWKNPAQHLVAIVTLWDGSDFRSVATYVICQGGLYACKRIAIDKANVSCGLQLCFNESSQRSTYQHVSITCLFHLATSDSHLLVEIHLTCEEEATEEDNRSRVNGPTRDTQGVASLALGYVLHWAFSPPLLNPKLQ